MAYADLPQLKINHIDATEAPKIRIWASVVTEGWQAPPAEDLLEIKVLKRPSSGTPVELFSFVDDEVLWPKHLNPTEIKNKEANPPEFLTQAELEDGTAIVVVAPGFQDPEYRSGTLGERARNGASLFFKKLGQDNLMNVIWYNDFVWTYILAEGRTQSLTRLQPELEACEAWERKRMERWGHDADALLAAKVEAGLDPSDVFPDEAHCGLVSQYENIAKLVSQAVYDGFWPQLFGLDQPLCVTPEHRIKSMGFRHADEGQAEERLQAFEVALKMLAEGGEPGQPKILILTGDGRDGYIHAESDCRAKFLVDCEDKEEMQALRGRARDEAVQACVLDQLKKGIAISQNAFVEKLPTWLALAKAANIRIYSVIHPSAPPHARERLEVLAWRTGGTARYAEDPDAVVTHYESLITELRNQIVITFVDEEAEPESTQSYLLNVSGRLGLRTGRGAPRSRTTVRSEAVAVQIPPAVTLGFIAGIQAKAQGILGGHALLILVVVVALILLIVLIILLKKLFGGGAKAAQTKAQKKKIKQAKAIQKAKAKAKKKAKKKAQKGQ